MKNNKMKIVRVKIVYGMWKMCLIVNRLGSVGI